MALSVIKPVTESLSKAIGVPVSLLASVPSSVRRAVLTVVGDGELRTFDVLHNEHRYLACRYDTPREAVVVFGPYRRTDDPLSAAATLDCDAESRAIAALHTAAVGFRHAVENERQRLELASQLEVVSRSVLAVTSELSLETVLRRIVDLARELGGARYAALGVPGPTGELAAFITTGMSPEDEARLGHRPRGLGILGLLLTEPKTIRLADLGQHPASVGFPPNHPPMKSFLGVPIIARGQSVGNLYLTEKRFGSEFTEEDARLVEILARHAAVAIENARLYQAVETQQLRLKQIIDQLPEAVLVIEPNPDRVTMSNPQTSHLLGWEIEPPISLDDFLTRNPRFTADGMRIERASIPMIRSLLQGDHVSRDELQLRRPDGATMTILVNSTPIRDASGAVTAAVVVFQDITQIKDAEQLKDDFLSLVSHELRTPLTTIQGGASMLMRDWQGLDEHTRQQFLSDISSESRRLAGLIENMVHLANIRAGRHVLETEPVLVRSLVQHAVDAERQLAPDRAFSVDIEPGLLASADPGRLDQVVRNIIHNAVKYSPAGTPVDVTARREDGMVVISVRDYGPGISDEDMLSVFERFHRTDGAKRSNTPGMGLGLYLARIVIEAHGGRVWIERPEGGGARVVFTVPTIDDDDSEW
jgi:PAS domain S-box-containing protein